MDACHGLSRGSTTCAAGRWFVNWLTPSFFRSRPEHATSAASKIAALDGLRGFACLAVLHGHWSLAVDDHSYNVGALSHGVMWKPLINLLWNGTASVTIFFAISGYVLAYKPLKLMSSGNVDAYKCIASSIFRRGFRLFLPPIGAIFILAILTQLGAFDAGWRIHEELGGLAREPPPPVAPSFPGQVATALWECYLLITTSIPGVQAEGDIFSYDKHVWTLPEEFKSSMVMFTLLMGTSLLTTFWRLSLHGGFMLYCLFIGRHDAALFVGGMIMAEIDLNWRRVSCSDRTLSRVIDEATIEKQIPCHAGASAWCQMVEVVPASWLLAFLLGLFLLSVPGVEPVTSWPYNLIADLLPSGRDDKNKLIRSLGALLTTWSCVNSSVVEPLFVNSLAHYLGKISFALYLTHGCMIRSLGYMLIGLLRRLNAAMTRETTSLGQFIVIWLTGYVLMLPFFFWAADLFWRSVDTPSVSFARRIERRLSSNNNAAQKQVTTQGQNLSLL